MKCAAQEGAGLVEIAVALLILSIGTLGLAKGQLAARQSAFGALQHSEAVFLAASLLELVRSNPQAMPLYSLAAGVEPSAPEVNCTQQACSAVQWGAWNRWQWWEELLGSRTQDAAGRASGGLLEPVACVAADDSNVSVALSWRIVPGKDEAGCEGLLFGQFRGGLSLVSRVGEA